MNAVATRIDQHPVRWMTAAPLWTTLLAEEEPSADDIDRMQRPTLLRLASDDFMDDLAALLADRPERLTEVEARPKSYRPGPPGSPAGYEAAIDHVKLFQPVHGHFNLVAATLVCRIAGLPDKAVDLGAEESAGFVLRRMAGDDELGWNDESWVELDGPELLGEGEQILPMFPQPYQNGDRVRRLFVGLVPTSSTESFKSGSGAVSFSPQPGDRAEDPQDRRLEQIDTTIIEPLRALRQSLIPPGLNATELKQVSEAEAEQKVEASRFLLLDLGEFLLREAPQLWDAVQKRQEPAASGLAAAYRMLRDEYADMDRGSSWLEALLAVWGERERIWGEVPQAPSFKVNLGRGSLDPAVDPIRDRLAAALPERTEAQKAEPQPPFDVPKLDPRATIRYVIRCVYLRPHCGPLHPDIVSDPSEPFAIAGFFDPDAPARPLHIALPIDTSIAGLRKSPKNVTFAISRELRQQMNRVKDAQKALDGKLSAAEPLELGMICSFSIPIITICALLVLMIFVALLNIIFWWMPFLRICFPIPLRGRG